MMKTGIMMLIAMLSLLFLAIAFSTQQAGRWEYRIDSLDDEAFSNQINSLGSEGWELVFVRRAMVDSEKPGRPGHYECIFKRRKQLIVPDFFGSKEGQPQK